MLQRCQNEANNGKFKLRDVLSVPMQRILKYHLLLEKLIEETQRVCFMHCLLYSAKSYYYHIAQLRTRFIPKLICNEWSRVNFNRSKVHRTES